MSDKIKRFLAYNGKINVICASTTNLVEEIRKIHDLSPLGTAALGRLSTICAIMSSQLKNTEDIISIELKGNGPIGKIIAVGNQNCEIKAYVENTKVDLPLNEDQKLDVGRAVGNQGYINVIKDIGLKEPYIGIAPITSGEIADDFANYFVKSEGQQVAVALGVLVNKEGVKTAGGYIIKPMPDASIEDISNIEQAIFQAGAISKMLDKGLNLEEIAKQITADENIKEIGEQIIPKYKCNCSKEKFEKGLISLGKQELENLINTQETIETTCQFCNKKYEFTKNEIIKIYDM